MKICAACSQELPKEKISKKQWQLKSQRRCKECIAENRDVHNVEVPNEAHACADGEGASDEDLFKEPPPNEECPICMLPLPFDRSMVRYQSC